MATSTNRSPSTKRTSAAKKAPARSARSRSTDLHEELALMQEPAIAKAPVSAKIDRALAREVELLLRGSDESMSQFVAAAIEREYHRRRGIRAVKELTLKDISQQIYDLQKTLAIQGEYNLAEARQANAIVQLVAQAVGVRMPAGRPARSN